MSDVNALELVAFFWEEGMGVCLFLKYDMHM